jgi:tight adherence protein B
MIGIAFISILALTFVLVAVVTRPTQWEKTVHHRIESIHDPSAGVNSLTGDNTQLLKSVRTSKFGWFDDLLERSSLASKLERKILQSNAKATAGSVVLTSVGLGAAALLVTYIFLPVLLIAASVALGFCFLPFMVLSFRQSRRVNKFNAALPDAIDMMSRALRAGHSIVASIEMVAENSVDPVDSEFGEVFKQQNFGLPLRDALIQMLERVPSQDLRVLVTAILVQRDTGGNLVEILDRTVEVIRERLRIQGEIRINTAQGRMTGWILSALPIVMLVLINFVNPGYSRPLLDDPLGRKIMYVGFGLMVTGTLVIRQIVNGVEV